MTEGKLSILLTRHDLGTVAEQIQTEQEKVKEEDNGADAECNPAPFLGGVDAARGANFRPCGITNLGLVNLAFGKVAVPEMNRVGGTLFARRVTLFGLNFSSDRFGLTRNGSSRRGKEQNSENPSRWKVFRRETEWSEAL